MIVVENKFFILKIGEDGIAKSLILRSDFRDSVSYSCHIVSYTLTNLWYLYTIYVIFGIAGKVGKSIVLQRKTR